MCLRDQLENWLRRVWNEQDRGAIREMMADEAVVNGAESTPLDGPESFELFHSMVFDIFSEIEIKVVQAIEEGEWIAARLEVNAVARRDKAKVRSRGHMMSRFVEGRLVEGCNLFDNIDIFEQMGLLPARTLDQCFLGYRPRFSDFEKAD